MPHYDYECKDCGVFEEYQSMKDDPYTKCPRCNSKQIKRLIGTGAGIIFKGSGFYETDYRSESYSKGAQAAEKAKSDSGSSGDSGSGSKSESKSESKSSSTSESKGASKAKPKSKKGSD